jgi:hypothetical protein
VSLLHTTQKLNIRKSDYDIELIDYHDQGKKTEDNYTYLRFRLISDIKEVREYLTRSFSLDTSVEEKLSREIETLLSRRQNNIFDIWLRARGEYLQYHNVDISTKTNIFRDYISEGIS